MTRSIHDSLLTRNATCSSSIDATTLPIGTMIYTLDGALPVEYLSPGDRIVTRAGAKKLRGVLTSRSGFQLSFDRPEVFYADGAEIRAI